MLLFGVCSFLFQVARFQPFFLDISPSPLAAEDEQALKPGDKFRECTNCPDMVVIPGGKFKMGSPADQFGHKNSEGPPHEVTIGQRFAVGKFELTVNEWNACAAHGGCRPLDYLSLDFILSSLRGGLSGREPASSLSWDNAQQYVAWIVKVTGKPYRLLTEAEWEYAARGGKTTAYFWGDEIGKENANCTGCRGELSRIGVEEVGRFKANAFGLHDMHGNVAEWVEDCSHERYVGNPPIDGSAWTAEGNCDLRVIRGGSWYDNPPDLRSAARISQDKSRFANTTIGFRISRTLTP
ncbi:formylglycine-generating enzyme family protein [Nordella sp. HKS 07]|nr:formylglycine-generating enzyme family protein [Nordella sp. HKS 07]